MIPARLLTACLAALAALPGGASAQRALDTVHSRKPDAIVDLRTEEGLETVRGVWRYRDASVVPVRFQGPGPDLRPTGPPLHTFDIEPKAGAASFDDAAWQVISPTSLEGRRSTGRLSFNWYRLRITIPQRIAGFDPSGATVVLEVVVDDYAEVWVDGHLPRTFGQAGGAFAQGYNARNRIVIARDAHPGQQVQLAIFGANGPLSDPPPNFIWIRSATLEFYASPAVAGVPVELGIERLDPALDAIVPRDVVLERVADGFEFLEGPVWVPDGYLLVSDPNRNTIYRYTPGEGVEVFRTKSGYTGGDIARYHQPGSNGLTLDPEGRLTINEHGNRRVVRVEQNGVTTVLADRHDGRRLNSPNDLVYRSDGSLYFTDPPFGLPRTFEDPARELTYSGVYRAKDGVVTLLTRELSGPNGIAFSPDERVLYVGNWDEARKVVMRYDVHPDGTLGPGSMLLDLTGAPGEEAIDGVKVDAAGHVYVSGPGGLWIVAADGRRLGRLQLPELAANFAWGDDDGRTLYLAARTGLYRVRLKIPGVRPPARPSGDKT